MINFQWAQTAQTVVVERNDFCFFYAKSYFFFFFSILCIDNANRPTSKWWLAVSIVCTLSTQYANRADRRRLDPSRLLKRYMCGLCCALKRMGEKKNYIEICVMKGK